MRLLENSSIKFIQKFNITAIISGTLFIGCLFVIIFMGLHYGIDFKGGAEAIVHFDKEHNAVEIKTLLGASEVKTYGSAKEFLIRLDSEKSSANIKIDIDTILKTNYDDFKGVLQLNSIGAKFSEDLRLDAIYAIVIAITLIFLYIAIRFKNWRFSLGAVVALIHDIVIVLGVISILYALVPFSLEIDQTILAAILTIVGYSLNDTVVVFDRIRENLTNSKGYSIEELMDRSLNSTLSRTIVTSLTTLFGVIILFIFGGEILKGFSFTLLLGVLIGTYSSLFVASYVVFILIKKHNFDKK